jgi:RNA polymerase sigma-70 factor (ECF subfamily)
LWNREDALDATQEVFARKWAAIDTYDPSKASFRTWLSRNAHNLIVDRIRNRERRPKQVSIDEIEDTLCSDRPVDDVAMISVALSKCLTAFDLEHRHLVIMHEVEQYTWEEVASLTGLTVAQARTRVSQALQQLRKCLSKQGLETDN